MSTQPYRKAPDRQPTETPKPPSSRRKPKNRYAEARGHEERGPQVMLPLRPHTIDYRCQRCGVKEKSRPLPTDPKALMVYGLPLEWLLGSALQHELGPERVICKREQEDFCLCLACVTDVRKGYPIDIADLALGQGGQP